MDTANQNDDEQARLWNGPGGRAWVELQEQLDQLYKPFQDLLARAVSVESPSQVLDIGCGTGGTTLAVSRLLGAKGRAVGIDISDPMIAVARNRAARERSSASFIRANVQSYAFEPASFDMIISRFGVMFFDDSVQAFKNLRHAAKPAAKLDFIAWRSAAENSFMTTAARAAAPLLPHLPVRAPDAPGQFAFADRRRVHSILEASGWEAIDIQPIDVTCTMPERELLRYVSWLGPVGAFLQEADDLTRTQVIQTVRAAFDPYVHGDEVRFTAACWVVGARAIAG